MDSLESHTSMQGFPHASRRACVRTRLPVRLPRFGQQYEFACPRAFLFMAHPTFLPRQPATSVASVIVLGVAAEADILPSLHVGLTGAANRVKPRECPVRRRKAPRLCA